MLFDNIGSQINIING